MKHMVTEWKVLPVFLIKQRAVKYNGEKEVQINAVRISVKKVYSVILFFVTNRSVMLVE